MLSKTGRKIRKDSFEAHNDMTKIKDYLEDLYINRELSTNEIPDVMAREYGISITSSKCYNVIRDMGILRGKSEAVSLAARTLDYNVSLLDERMTGIIEGILIGDGTISCNHNTKVGRLSISGQHEEFINYCYKLLISYMPNSPKYTPSDGKKGGTGVWSISTKNHPDFYKIYNKWYVPKKDIPDDIKFTDLMLLLWYLGDGSLSSHEENNSITLYFSTNSFSRDKIEHNLVPKFEEIGIYTSRITKDNRLFIKSDSIVKLLQYMGKCPVDCYSYKFDIDSWRFNTSMKEASKRLDLDYYKLCNWVKTGIVEHSRSPGGKKVVFTEKEFNELKRRLDYGELSRIKGKKAIRNKNKSISDINILKGAGETDEEYINRIVDIFIQKGFPYKDYSQEQKQKKWVRLRASQYIIPEINIIKWRREGLPLADSFHPHIYDLNRKGKLSPYNLFNNKDMLRECLVKNHITNGAMTSAKLLSSVCCDARSPRLNNFSPSLSRDLYNYYCNDKDRVIDPCAGFSGRMIGASVSKRCVSYVGIDPSLRTYKGLLETKEFLNVVNPLFSTNIEHGGAENVLEKYRDDYFNFCFTSPPYFDLEEYDIANTQSYIKFSTYDQWKVNFLGKTLSELYRVLIGGSFCVINIGKSGRYDIPHDTIEIAKDIGFTLVENKFISFPVYGFVDSEGDRLEPLLIFQKPIIKSV